MGHRWSFVRRGESDQVDLRSGADIANLKDLDQKLWMSLACPIDALVFDQRTLELLRDGNESRIRVKDVLNAVEFLQSILSELDLLTTSGESVDLSLIRTDTPQGESVLRVAKDILTKLGKGGEESITLADADSVIESFMQERYNGDGILTLESMAESLKGVAGVVAQNSECVKDFLGKDGINEESIEAFYEKLQTFKELAEKCSSEADKRIDAPLIENFLNIRSKLDEWFLKSAITSYDTNALASLNPDLEVYKNISAEDLKGLPIVTFGNSDRLDTKAVANPIYRADFEAFMGSEVVVEFLEDAHLTKSRYDKLRAKMDSAVDLQNALAEARLAGVEYEDIETLASQKEALLGEIAKDLQQEQINAGLVDVEKLLRFRAYFFTFLNNFVVFREFYDVEKKAIFQAGRLYIDGKNCDLCLEVKDVDAHASMAGGSHTYILYCALRKRESGESKNIAACVTSGDATGFMVGRNGLFYDRDGGDWDATIIKIVEAPISIAEAFWTPYKKVSSLIASQIEKFAKEKEDQAIATASQKALNAKEATPFDTGKFAGMLAAIGLGLGALATALSSMVSGIIALPFWQIPLLFIALVLIISLPSMFLAWLSLRKRNIAPLLDANGWAINASSKVNITFGELLTHLAQLPKGSKRSLKDPYAPKKTPLKYKLGVLILAVAFIAGIWLSI